MASTGQRQTFKQEAIMRVSFLVAGYSLAAVSLMAQTSPAPHAARPTFEAADIHTSPRSAPPVMRGPFYSGGRYELHYATMVDLIRIAYNVDADRVAGGPGWLEYDRYDVV